MGGVTECGERGTNEQTDPLLNLEVRGLGVSRTHWVRVALAYVSCEIKSGPLISSGASRIR